MEENQVYEKKSLKLFTKKNPDWNKLIKECVCLANRTGGIIEIGIEDDSDYPPANQKIPIKLRNDIQSKIENNTMNVGVEVISQVHNSSEYLKVVVKRNKEAIASTTSGRYFIRVGEECKPLLPDELQRLMEDKSSFTWELKTNLNLDISIYDREKASDFIDSITKSNRVTKFIKDKTFEEILAHYFLIDGNKFTNLGVLWIGKREQRARLSYAPAVQVIKYDSTEKKIRKDSYDDYSLNPQELIQTIWDKTPEFKYFEEISDGIYRKNIYDYDEKVIRELLANCIVHRPYTTRGDIFINIFEDRIEFHNPGLLPIPVTPKNILHESVPRNQHLASLFYALNLMEKEGSGYDKIYEQLLFSGKQLPVVEELEDRVKVTIFKAIIDKDVIRFLNNVSKEFELKTKEKLTLGIIAQHHSLSLTEISDIIGLEEVKVDRDWISGLLEKNILVKKGKTSGMQYLINPKLLKNYKFKGRTNLKTIENHRLKELIREDLSKFPMSNRSDIHERIGKEINTRRVRQILKIMQDENIIKKIGNTSNTVYTLKDIKQK